MKKLIIILLAGLIFQSCKKDDTGTLELGSLTLVNAAVDVASAKMYASDKAISWSAIPTGDAVAFANFKHFAVIAGTKNVMAANVADTTRTLYNSSQNFKLGGMNTLFLCGQSGSYEGVYLVDESLPNYTDEVVGIRFINLSPNSPALSVNLTATPTVNEATGLAYKQNSAFKTYLASNVTTGIAFQVKNATTGALLASYTLPATAVSPYTTATVAQARFKNVTLVIKGLVGTTTGANAFGVFPVSHY